MTGLGQLTLDWAREGLGEDGKKIVGAVETTYDLTSKDGIRKLVTHMSAFSNTLKGAGNQDKREALIQAYEKVIQEVRGKTR
mgnify:FL=1